MMKNQDKIKIAFLFLMILLLVIFFPQISSIYQNTETLLQDSTIAPILYGTLMILAILIAPIPASPLAIIAGSVFGPFLGMFYTLISATIGAMLAFLIGRFLLKDSLGKKLEQNKTFKRFEGKDNKNIVILVFLTRLMPQVSFDLVSYAAGLTSVNLWAFTLATLIGLIPIVFLLSFFGSVIAPFINIILLVLLIAFILYVIYKIKQKP